MICRENPKKPHIYKHQGHWMVDAGRKSFDRTRILLVCGIKFCNRLNKGRKPYNPLPLHKDTTK